VEIRGLKVIKETQEILEIRANRVHKVNRVNKVHKEIQEQMLVIENLFIKDQTLIHLMIYLHHQLL
jgi:hypothetical protein